MAGKTTFKLFTRALPAVFLVVAGLVMISKFHEVKTIAEPSPEMSARVALVVLGDSHFNGPFGARLMDLMLKPDAGLTLRVSALCGATPAFWTQGGSTQCGYFQRGVDGNEVRAKTGDAPGLDEMLQGVKVSLVIQIGTNLIPMSEQQRKSEVEALLRAQYGRVARCTWIGPPDARRYSEADLEAVYSLLHDLTRSYHCTLIDSRRYTSYPETGGDGVHYTTPEASESARNWAWRAYSGLIAHPAGQP